MRKEPICEPWFRSMRVRRILSFIKPEYEVLDVGCGVGSFIKALGPFIKNGVGIDKKAGVSKEGNIKLLQADFDGKKLPLKDNQFDCVTMLAVLEHLNNRLEILKEIRRVLKPGGNLLITVPSWAAKPVLEFLSYRLGIVNEEEVRDHKTYFWKKELLSLAEQAGFRDLKHKYFQLVFNNFLHARK